MQLNWKYCECGCKSYEISAGKVWFKLFWDLKDGWYLTGEGHYRTKFDSEEEANEIVKESFRKAYRELKEICKD